VRGRIKVYVRPRPFDDESLVARGGNALSVGGLESDECTVTDDKGRESAFGFDHVFKPSTKNDRVFETVGLPIVNSVLVGYNGTLMAYGQTGTGKTHTLGSSEDGMLAQMFGYLFASIDADHAMVPEASSATRFQVSLSYVQVYKEKTYDLLHPVDTDRPLALRERVPAQSGEGGVYIENVTEHRVASVSRLELEPHPVSRRSYLL
jgi:kinesin family member 5